MRARTLRRYPPRGAVSGRVGIHHTHRRCALAWWVGTPPYGLRKGAGYEVGCVLARTVHLMTCLADVAEIKRLAQRSDRPRARRWCGGVKPNAIYLYRHTR